VRSRRLLDAAGEFGAVEDGAGDAGGGGVDEDAGGSGGAFAAALG
jgi:hypothetical protein